MEHPIVKNMMSTGEPDGVVHEPIGFDHFDNELYSGDLVYEFNDNLYLIEYLTREMIEILEEVGATKRTLE